MKFVITGGPGCGKSTIIAELAKLGYPTFSESARDIIKQELAVGGDRLPWANWRAMQAVILELQLRKEAAAESVGFFDRGLPDGLAYYLFLGVSPPLELLKACSRAKYRAVFLLERLPNYENDAVRREDLESARRLTQFTETAYRSFGYEPVSVPVLPPAERAKFILQNAGIIRLPSP
jgi:predicted ATPase